MTNGSLARIIYAGSWISILMCLVSITILSMADKSIPVEIQMVLTGSFGIVGGAHLDIRSSKERTDEASDS